MVVKNYQDTANFYLGNFNFAISDQLYDEEQNNRTVAAFVRLDRGKEYTDHHAIFFLEKEKTHDHHASFEVVDFDHQLIAHEYLLSKGYKVCIVCTLIFALNSGVVCSTPAHYFISSAGVSVDMCSVARSMTTGLILNPVS